MIDFFQVTMLFRRHEIKLAIFLKNKTAELGKSILNKNLI